MTQKYDPESTSKIHRKDHASEESESEKGYEYSSSSKTPWGHDEHRYLNLVNTAGNLRVFGWIIFSLTAVIGMFFLATGLASESSVQKTLAISVGIAFALFGIIIKIVWNVFAELINLFIDVANDVHTLKK